MFHSALFTTARTNVDFLLIGHLGTNFSEIRIEIENFRFIKNAFENVVCEIAAIVLQNGCNFADDHHVFVGNEISINQQSINQL